MLRFSISSPSLQYFISNSTMSSSRFNARGRGPWNRGFCYRPPWDGGGGGGDHPFVSGDSHLNTVREANYGYRQGYGGNYSIPRASPGKDFRPRQPPQFRPQLQPQFHPHPQFRPHSQPQFRSHQQPQFRPHPQQHRPDDHRNWVYAVSQPPRQCERFTVLSYNILADYLARDHRSKLYFHIPHHILDWEWRKKRLFLEFGLWAPDIMCLQEVDRFHDLEEELAIRGYAGIWKMRTGNAVDGCAIFWRTNRFHLRHEEHIEFNKLGLRDNVAQICVLESRNQNPAENPSTSFRASSDQSRGVNQIVICNIHVLYNPKRGEMKLGQVRLLLDRAYAVSRIWNDAPVIVCGDFNSTPKSPLYNFLSERKLSLSGLARDQISGQYAASVYAPRPYVGFGVYRPERSEAKDIERGNSFKGVDSNQKYQNDIENSSRKEKVASPHMLTVMPSGKLLSDGQNIMEVDKLSDSATKEIDEVGILDGCSGDDTSSPSRFVSQSQRKDEGCKVPSEIPLNIGNFLNQDVTDSHNEPCSGELELEHGGNSSTIQSDHSIRSTLSGFLSQSNECVPNELSNHDLYSSSDRELCQELKDLLHGETNISKSNSVTSVVPTTHENLTDPDILKENMTNQAPLLENQSDTTLEKTMFYEGLLDSKPQNDFGTSISSFDMASGTSSSNAEVSVLENMETSPSLATEEKICFDVSYQNSCRIDQLNSSTCNGYRNEVDRTMMEDLHSDGDCGNTGSAKMLPCTEENATLDINNHNVSLDSNSEESNQFSEKVVSAGGSYKEQLEDHSDFGQDGTVIDESCSLEENSDPNFFRELIGTEDARDCTELYGENNCLFTPVHKAGNAENRANASVPTCLHNSELDRPTAKIHDDSPHPVAFPAANMEYSYNPYLWTPMEIEVASGNPGCSLVEHGLKLRSAYADVEDCAGTKDSSREPEVTSYNRLFMGTVDYIWYSEGLQTVKVLDTIPKHILQRTPGFPTRKWGSDHLALACELAFTNGVETTK